MGCEHTEDSLCVSLQPLLCCCCCYLNAFGFSEDIGINPDLIAQRFGMAYFSVMLKSELLKGVISITYNERDEIVYRPKEDVRISHLVSAEVLSASAKYVQ